MQHAKLDDHVCSQEAVCCIHCPAAPLPCPPPPLQEAIDGDLSSRVFMLLSCCDEGFHARRYDEPSRQRLDSAIINFFQAFRRVYIGEQVGGAMWEGGCVAADRLYTVQLHGLSHGLPCM